MKRSTRHPDAIAALYTAFSFHVKRQAVQQVRSSPCGVSRVARAPGTGLFTLASRQVARTGGTGERCPYLVRRKRGARPAASERHVAQTAAAFHVKQLKPHSEHERVSQAFGGIGCETARPRTEPSADGRAHAAMSSGDRGIRRNVTSGRYHGLRARLGPADESCVIGGRELANRRGDSDRSSSSEPADRQN